MNEEPFFDGIWKITIKLITLACETLTLIPNKVGQNVTKTIYRTDCIKVPIVVFVNKYRNMSYTEIS